MKKDHLKLPLTYLLNDCPQYWKNFNQSCKLERFTRRKDRISKVQRRLRMFNAHYVGIKRIRARMYNYGAFPSGQPEPYLKFRTERDKLMFVLKWS